VSAFSVERDGRVTVLSLDLRDEPVNLLTRAAGTELLEQVARVQADSSADAIVLASGKPEFLLFELLKACGDINDALAGDDDLGRTHLGLVLEVDADDAPLEDAQALDGDKLGGAPVAEIGTGTDAVVAAFYDTEDVERVPDLVIRLAHGAAVLVESDLDVGPFRGGLPCDDLFGGFGADGVETHLLGKVHDGVHLLGVAGADDAVVDGMDALACALGEEFLPGFLGHRVVNLLL
jgi:hypothetical protein